MSDSSASSSARIQPGRHRRPTLLNRRHSSASPAVLVGTLVAQSSAENEPVGAGPALKS